MTKYKKNILCEKPLSVNKKETQVMIDAAKEADVFFMAGLWSRFFPAQKMCVHELLLQSFLPGNATSKILFKEKLIRTLSLAKNEVSDSNWDEELCMS